jgi:hypothetical protein
VTTISYTPTPTCNRFLLDRSFIRIIMGPFGSGKSTACVMDLWSRAAEQPPDSNGVRHSRHAIVRNTARKLLDTTVVTFLKWFPDGVAGHWYKTSKTYITEYRLADGTTVKAEFLFRALDDADDVENLASLELNTAYFNEFKEIHRAIFDTMKGRVGRYVPQGVDPKKTPVLKYIIADTNPPVAAEYDWLYVLMEMDIFNADWLGKIAVFKQPSGLSEEAENLDYLPGGKQYYLDMCIGATDEFIKMNVHGEYGTALGGTAVFSKSFRMEMHVAKKPLRPVRNAPWGEPLGITIGMDFGLTPAAVIMQQDTLGQIRVLDEIIGNNIHLRQFLRTQLKPLLAARYAGMKVRVAGDPAGRQRSQSEGSTCYDILEQEGFFADGAETNALVRRIGVVEDKLRTLVDEGQPAFLISPHCTTIIKAFAHGYVYKEVKTNDGTIHTEPSKNQYSHPMDALQYGVLEIDIAGIPVEDRPEDEGSPLPVSDNVTGY